MLFDDEKLSPLYKLKLGQPGSSYTFEVARNVGLPKDLIDKARAGLKEGTVRFEDTIHNYQRLTTELQISKEKFVKQEAFVDRAKSEYKNKLIKLDEKIESQRELMDFESKYLNLGKRISKIIEAYRKGTAMKTILPRIKKIIELESNRKEENKEDSKLSKLRKLRTKESFKLNEQVRIEGTSQQGEILELKANSALLQIGFAKMEVKFEKLEKVIPNV